MTFLFYSSLDACFRLVAFWIANDWEKSFLKSSHVDIYRVPIIPSIFNFRVSTRRHRVTMFSRSLVRRSAAPRFALQPRFLSIPSSPTQTPFPLSYAESTSTADSWLSSFTGIGSLSLTNDQVAILSDRIDSNDIEVKPDGLLYLPEIKYRRILNKAFKPGGKCVSKISIKKSISILFDLCKINICFLHDRLGNGSAQSTLNSGTDVDEGVRVGCWRKVCESGARWTGFFLTWRTTDCNWRY